MAPLNVKYESMEKVSRFYQESIAINCGGWSICELSEQILDLLNRIFGYGESNFWMLNQQSGTYYPVAHRVESSLMDRYARQYYKIDPFHPDNITKVKTKETVLSIRDIMSLEQYEASPYYKEFLGPSSHYYYETVMYLHQRGCIIGGIVVMRSKSEGEFVGEDIDRLKQIASYISKLASLHMACDEIKQKQRFFESLAAQSPLGQIVLEGRSPYRIYYMNPMALNYCEDICPGIYGSNHAEKFIRKYVLDNPSACMEGQTKILCSSTMRKYEINVRYGLGISGNAPAIFIYIAAQTACTANGLFVLQHNSRQLTERQQEIAGLVLKGCSNEEIAKRLFISVSTVKTHLNAIYSNWNVKNRLQLCVKLNDDCQR